jgi:hypothetical protein
MKKLYVVTRSDLPSGDQAVQAGHAVAEYIINRKGNFNWNNETLIYLVVDDLEKMELLMRKLRAKFIQYFVWCEPDLQNQMTAFACPCGTLDEGGYVSSCFDNLKMLGK